jgi:hypothetical protein
MNDDRRPLPFDSELLAEETADVPVREDGQPAILRAVPAQPRERDLPRLRAALGQRVDDCWDRLDDVVSELVALHEIGEADIVERVRSTVAAEAADAS